ncbi:hypothetical protein PanWU01x14_370260 [Parasponia andersonii]|uniref:Uncharacterized protein n=1 Tax=Parasponia andersonii TaxID=3476 RepID=A0A2P5A4B9_PARAD|nr:hypothetical protein PanWU01x14_370260 [Parasponia andersonii]
MISASGCVFGDFTSAPSAVFPSALGMNKSLTFIFIHPVHFGLFLKTFAVAA